MLVTYIGHSGAMVELDECTLLFDCVARDYVEHGLDYAPGVWPAFSKEKPLIVFASHRHKDHYSYDIWKLRKLHPDVTYVLAKEIPFSAGIRNRLELYEEDLAKVVRMAAGQTCEVPVGDAAIRVETLKSTDVGVAFYVTAFGHTIFHVGDLHLWIWEEEGDGYCSEMAAAFHEQRKKMEGREAEIAFLILDPRLEKTAFAGMDAWLETMKFSHIFPIHMWKQYDFVLQYNEHRRGLPENGILHEIRGENETFQI